MALATNIPRHSHKQRSHTVIVAQNVLPPKKKNVEATEVLAKKQEGEHVQGGNVS